jgi:hypothetical protein
MPFGSRTVKRKGLSQQMLMSLWLTPKSEKFFSGQSYIKKRVEGRELTEGGGVFYRKILDKLLEV